MNKVYTFLDINTFKNYFLTLRTYEKMLKILSLLAKDDFVKDKESNGGQLTRCQRHADTKTFTGSFLK